jgi:hypothetical protein
MDKPFRLQSFSLSGQYLGTVAPSRLHFATLEEGEIIADRYRAEFRNEEFRVVDIRKVQP